MPRWVQFLLLVLETAEVRDLTSFSDVKLLQQREEQPE